MATISYISPKAFFVKISELFQNKVQQITNHLTVSEAESQSANTENAIPCDSYSANGATSEQPEPVAKPKLSISIQDLKLISTALLHYRKELTKKGHHERADEVGKIDKRFYALITTLETRQTGQ